MNTGNLPALIAAVTALVTAVGTLVKLLQHVNSPNPHPAAAQAAEQPPAPGQVKAG